MTASISNLAADAEGRSAAQTRFHDTLVLEAGAGTGKTTTVVARVLSWSLDAGWEDAAAALGDDVAPERIAAEALHGVVAITFTEAGAAEMATRVAAGFAHLASAAPEQLVGFAPDLLSPAARDDLASRAHHLLGALDHLTIETIHAFCRGLLAASPLEAGLHPELRVDPDLRLTEEIVHEVVDEAVRRAYARPAGQPLARLAEDGIGPDRLAEVLVGLRELGLEATALKLDPLSTDGMARLTGRISEALATFMAAGGDQLRRVSSGNKAVAIAEAAERSVQLLAERPADVDALQRLVQTVDAEWRDHFTKLGSWRKGAFTKGEALVLGPIEESFSPATASLRALLKHFTKLRPSRFDAARRALGPMLAECERRAASRGVMTFSDLLSKAHRLLSTNRAIRRREQRRIRQLLVDEFQDTDPLQCEIVRLLALSGPAKDRPGLFLVGDPKQSIFGWRDADLAAYDGFVAEALAAGGARYPLVRNFRSDPPVLAEVSKVVEPVMKESPGLQPPFIDLAAHREGSRLDHPQWSPVEYWVSWLASGPESGPETRGDEAAALEAGAIAADVEALHLEGGVRWNEVALLFRSTHRMDAYLEALRERDIPFVVTRDKHYYRRKEVIEAAALVRSIVDPLDHLALVGYLRSAAVGIPDAALIPLWQHDFPRLVTAVTGPESPALAELVQLVEKLPAMMPPEVPGLDRIDGWHRILIAALRNLARLRRCFSQDPATTFVDALRHSTLIEVTEAARYQGKFRLANLDRFFRRLEESMVERGNDIQAILRTLRRSLVEAPDAKEAPPKDSGDDAVQVLTIHKAKGLEFDHVYVPQMHSLHRRANDLPLFDVDRRWRNHDEPQYCLLHAATPRWSEVAQRAEDVEAKESVRLLYVALTRARQRVVLIGKWPGEVRPVDPERARSPLDLVHSRQGLPRQLTELADAVAAQDRSWLDEAEIRWRFLGALPPSDSRRRRKSTPDWVPKPEAVAIAATDLRQRTEDAAARMARPFKQAASAAAATKLESLAAGQETREPGSGVSRDLAMLVGTSIHRIFEEWDLDGDHDAELDKGRRRLEERLERWLPEAEAEIATARAGELLTRFRRGSLWSAWIQAAPRVVARELPILVPTRDDDPVLDHRVGSVDLIYRDEDDAWIVVDFKTDQVEGDAAIAARAEVYASQEAIYADALQSALELEEPPVRELWFLWPDRLWRTP